MAMNKGKARPAEEQVMVAEAELPPKRAKRKAAEPVMTSYLPDEPDLAGGLRMSYYVELGTFADPENVDRIAYGLEQAGRISITELSGSDGPLYKLRIGPIADVNDATVAYNQAVSFGLPDARITQAPLQEAALR
jgi:rare lipoprotein A